MSKYPIIVFEGIEASGKSTSLKKIIKYLKIKKIKYETFREPGGTNFSERFVPPGSLKDTYLILFVFKYLIIFFKLVDLPEASIPSKTIIGYLDITPD